MSRARSLAFRASLVANALFLVLALAWAVRRRERAAASDAAEDSYRRERRAVLASLPPREGATVLLGDSLTERGEWAELLGDPSVQNRGVAGDTTADVLARARDVAAQKPGRVFVMVGTNDLLAGHPVAEIAARHAAIVDVLRAAAPGARLFCQSVLPFREGLAPAAARNADVRALNEAIARLGAERSCTYVDVFSAVADGGGSLGERLTLDGVHLTGEGYALWARAIAPWMSTPR